MVDKTAMKNEWMETTRQWGASVALADKWIEDLFSRYQHSNRHYHDLSHIEQVLGMAASCKTQVECWDAVFFAAWFHDAIQKMGIDSEGESAKLAKQALAELNVPQDIISRTAHLILATKFHDGQDFDNDASYFIDCDLSILGSHWPVYERYKDQCRKEYKVPGFLYHRGRKKFLAGMLDKSFIFQTGLFREKYQAIARENMRRELDLL